MENERYSINRSPFEWIFKREYVVVKFWTSDSIPQLGYLIWNDYISWVRCSVSNTSLGYFNNHLFDSMPYKLECGMIRTCLLADFMLTWMENEYIL